ncbi:MAG: hypothetical protein AB7O37_21395 [Vicinamibacteria bacterium]
MDHETVEEIKRHFGIVVEGLESRMQLVAEGQASLRATIDGMRGEVAGELREVKGLIKFSHTELDRRANTADAEIKDLRSRIGRLEEPTTR